MTDLDPETKTRIEAEERYRAELRAGQGSGFSTATAVGALGGVLLALGAFVPIATLPVVGPMTLFGKGSSDGLFLLILGLAAVIFSFVPKALLVLTGVGLVALLVGLLDYKNIMALQNGEFGRFIQPQLGWGVIALGILLVLIAPILRRR